MKALYVYPIIFAWDQIIPTDYPFIKMAGPNGTHGVLVVFDNLEAYSAFCGDKWHAPIEIQQQERINNEQQNGRDRQGKGESEVLGAGQGSNTNASRAQNGMAKRGRKRSS